MPNMFGQFISVPGQISIRGGAAINALAAAADADVWVVDVGVDGPIPATAVMRDSSRAP